MKLGAPESSPSLRMIAAATAGLAGGIVFRASIDTRGGTVWIPVGALLVACIASFIPHLGAQLLARALWWSNLVLGVIVCVLGSGSHEKMVTGSALMLGCGAALVLADRRALAAAAAAAEFRPAAYAGTIELVAVLALADAQTLLLFAAITAADRPSSPAPYFALCALALVAGFVGVYKLRLWGFIVTMSTVAILAVSLFFRLIPDVDTELRDVLRILCGAQFAAPIPMLVSMARKRPLPAASPRIRSMVASGFVVFVVLAALLWSATH